MCKSLGTVFLVFKSVFYQDRIFLLKNLFLGAFLSIAETVADDISMKIPSLDSRLCF